MAAAAGRGAGGAVRAKFGRTGQCPGCGSLSHTSSGHERPLLPWGRRGPRGLQLSLITLRQKPSGAAPSPPSGSSGCGSRSGGRGAEAARAHRGLVTCFSRRFRTLTLAAVVRLSGGEMAAREGKLRRWARGSEPSHFSEGEADGTSYRDGAWGRWQ